MKHAGTKSWQIITSEWDFQLEWALWVRAAERIEVPVGGLVTGPPDVDPLPAPSVPSGAPLAEGWLFWWRAVVSQPVPSSPFPQNDLAELGRFGPPGFSALDAYPDLQRVVAAGGKRPTPGTVRASARVSKPSYPLSRATAGGREPRASSCVRWRPRSGTRLRRSG